MEFLYDIVGFAALAHLIVEFNTDLQLTDKKPFTCNLCMGFWLAILPGFFQWGLGGLLFAALAGVTSELIYKILTRL